MALPSRPVIPLLLLLLPATNPELALRTLADLPPQPVSSLIPSPPPAPPPTTPRRLAAAAPPELSDPLVPPLPLPLPLPLPPPLEEVVLPPVLAVVRLRSSPPSSASNSGVLSRLSLVRFLLPLPLLLPEPEDVVRAAPGMVGGRCAGAEDGEARVVKGRALEEESGRGRASWTFFM